MESDGDIIVQVSSAADMMSEAYMAMPVSTLGTRYYAITYVDAHANTGHYQGPSHIGVIATQDNTKIMITTPSWPTSSYIGEVDYHDLMKYDTYSVSDLLGCYPVITSSLLTFQDWFT